MNINTDNYEAYLLDYMEGNLSPEGAAELQAFVKAQGLDWSELTEELPRLEAPQIEFEDKERLKKKRAVMPLYVKMASAAAAAGLLLTVTLWPEKQLPSVEPIANLKPIEAIRIETQSELSTLPVKPVHFAKSQIVVDEKHDVIEKTDVPILAELNPIRANETQIAATSAYMDSPNFDLLAYRLNTHLAFVKMEKSRFDYDENDKQELSLIGKAIFRMTEGKYNNLASLINAGLSRAKQEVTQAATDVALTAYNNVNEQIEEAKEHWEEKQEE